MASSKKSTTSKTARVMNLLSKSREEVPAEQPIAPAPVPAAPEVAAPPVQSAPTVEAAAAPAPVAHANHTTPLISSMQTDSAISNQVLSALESALDEELSAKQQEAPAAPAVPTPTAEEFVAESVEAPVAQSSTVSVEPPVLESSIPSAEAPAEEPVVEAASVPETVAEVAAETVAVETPVAPTVSAPVASAPAPSPVSNEPEKEPAPPTQFKVDSETTYVNVMETLVEEKANKYIDLFGLCKCHRCIADVKAYALNHLSPKYVVMRTGEVIPRITLYENQFSAVVTAQILNACKVVMASPRHDLS